MTGAEPTAGEWEVGFDNKYDCRAVGVHGTKQVICHISPTDKMTAEDEANAHLIAAAPELLAACKRILAAPYGVALGDLEFVTEAVAKAEGRP